MILLRSTHDKRVRELHAQYELVVGQYEARIADLKQQISDLQKLVFPKNDEKEPPLLVLEADAVISASDKPSGISEEEHNRLLEESREADLLFSGNYDTDLV